MHGLLDGAGQTQGGGGSSKQGDAWLAHRLRDVIPKNPVLGCLKCFGTIIQRDKQTDQRKKQTRIRFQRRKGYSGKGWKVRRKSCHIREGSRYQNR